MKKTYFILLFCVASFASKAQYVMGDLNVMPQPMMAHDSNLCTSTCNLMYAITISNSFIGDTVKIKDQFSGSLVIMDINTTGANPWYVYLPAPIVPSIQDDMVSGGGVMFFGPTLKVICGPDTVFNIVNNYFLPVTNPCTYGLVSGKVYIDNNADCSFNAGDQPLASLPLVCQENWTSPSFSGGSTLVGYSNGSGDYSVNVQETWMTDYFINLPSNLQFIFPSTACSAGIYTGTTVPQTGADFSLQCSSNVDVQCNLGSAGVVRPNIPFNLYPSVSNTGCDSASGQLRLVLDNRVVYNPGASSAPLPTVSGDTLTWNYSNLTNLTAGGYWNSFFASVNVTPIPSVTVGDILCFSVWTDVPPMDVDPVNNYLYYSCLHVVNSWDPNFKEVSPVGYGVEGFINTQYDTTLTYTVHFQNTGTAPAINISVIDTLDSDLIPNSLQILGSSHPVYPEWIAPGVVKFNFYSINLADSTSNEAASHGSITFKVKRPPGLPSLTEIKNTANIYFDFNPAVVTNTVLNTIDFPFGVDQIQSDNNAVNVFPNPFSDNATFKILSDKSNEVYAFELKDVLGKNVRSVNNISEKEFTVSRNDLQSGIYFYKIYTTEQTIGIGKLIIK